MYAHKARNSIIRVLMEAPELADLQAKPVTDRAAPTPWSKVKGVRTRKLADRLLVELWMMGFAVSARNPTDRPPEGATRDPEKHKAWRNTKLKPPPKDNQKDVEAQAQKPPDAA